MAASGDVAGVKLVSSIYDILISFAESLNEDILQGLPDLFSNPFSDIMFEKLRLDFIGEDGRYDRLWHLIHAPVIKILESSLDMEQTDDDHEAVEDEDFKVLTTVKHNRKAWLNAWISSGKEKKSPSAPHAFSSSPNLAKLSINIDKYNGERGKCMRWWKKVRDTIALLHPLPNCELKLAWIPVIQDALTGYPEGQKLLSQLRSKGERDTDKIMNEFVKHHDKHALDNLYNEWNHLKQGDRQSISDFLVTFNDSVQDLQSHGYVLNEFNQWVCFRNKVKHAAKLREKEEIKDISSAVEYLSRCESSNLRKKTGKGLKNINADESGLLNKIVGDGTNTKLNRCSNCHRLPKHHKTANMPMGRQCRFKKATLKQQLRFEANLKKRKTYRTERQSKSSKSDISMIAEVMSELKKGEKKSRQDEEREKRKSKIRKLLQGQKITAQSIGVDEKLVTGLVVSTGPMEECDDTTISSDDTMLDRIGIYTCVDYMSDVSMCVARNHTLVSSEPNTRNASVLLSSTASHMSSGNRTSCHILYESYKWKCNAYR